MLRVLAGVDVLWDWLWLPMARFGRHMTWQRSDREMRRLGEVLGPDYRVDEGPFKGMKYPHFESVGSSLLGKLTGTYEVELAGWVERLLQTPYELVVDIGCAEGYYAVGFAMRKPEVEVHAYDTNERARQLCANMAALNGVANRVRVEGLCSAQELASLVRGRRALVISDCEGGELDVFAESVMDSLSRCDVLIEPHDFVIAGVSETLKMRFHATHECAVAHNMFPLEKAAKHPSRLMREKDPEVLEWLYSEGRPESMAWLLFTPRLSTQAARRPGGSAAV